MSASTATSPRSTVPHTRPAKIWGAIAFLVAVAAAAGLGGLASSNAQETYSALDLPAWAPPSWLFGPAWGVLYILIAIAGWLVWVRFGIDRAIVLWCVQLVLNTIWTPLFFGAEMYWLAFAEICVMWVAIVITVALFAKRRRVAAWLMAPYLLWVTYASALNLAIAIAN